MITLSVATRPFIIGYYYHSMSQTIQGGPKTDTQLYFCDKFGNSAPTLTILSLLQAEIYGA